MAKQDSTALTVATPVIGTVAVTKAFTVLDTEIKAKCLEIEKEEKSFEEKNEKRATELVPLLREMHALLVSPGKRTDKDADAWTWGRWVASNKLILNTPMRTIYRIMEREGIKPQPKLGTGTKVMYDGEAAEVILSHKATGADENQKVDIFITGTEETKTVKATSVTKIKRVKLDTDVIYEDATSGKYFTYNGNGNLVLESTQAQREKAAAKIQQAKELAKPVKTTTKKQAEDKDKAGVKAAKAKASKPTRRKRAPQIPFVAPPDTYNAFMREASDDAMQIEVCFTVNGSGKFIRSFGKDVEANVPFVVTRYAKLKLDEATAHVQRLNNKYNPTAATAPLTLETTEVV